MYEDSDSDRSEDVIRRRREERGSGFDNEDGWRTERKRGEDYGSDEIPYSSPVHDRRRERQRTHGGLEDEYYGKMARLVRHNDGPSSSRFRRERSPSGDMSYPGSRLHSVHGRGYGDRDGRQYSSREMYSPTRRSPPTEDRRGRPKRERSSPSRMVKRSRSSPSRAMADDVRQGSGGRKRGKMLKPIQVDGLGIPVGMMKEQFTKDINSFVKEMNPCVGYEKQKQEAKDRLQDRIYEEYEVHGEADRVDEKYIKKCATKALITWRHTLNKALDTGDRKPPALNTKYWEELERIRDSEESKRKSQQMGNQARKRGLRNSTKDKIKHAALVKLVSTEL